MVSLECAQSRGYHPSPMTAGRVVGALFDGERLLCFFGRPDALGKQNLTRSWFGARDPPARGGNVDYPRRRGPARVRVEAERDRLTMADRRTDASDGRATPRLPAAGAASTEARLQTSASGTGTSGQNDELHEHSDIEVALDVLMILGRLGQSIGDALAAAADSDLVAKTEVIVICSLSLRGSLRPTDIMTLTGLSRGGLTKLFDRLVAGGLVVRALGTYAVARRATRLVLTPLGSQVARDFARALLYEIDAIRRGFAELLAAIEPIGAAEDRERH